MATIQELNDLNLKIANAKTERDKLDASINGAGQPGGNFKESLQQNCGVTWEANKPSPVCSTTFKCNGLVDCPTIWNLITARTNTIALLNNNIITWENQAKALLNDPQLKQDLEDQEKNRKIRNFVIVLVVISAITALAIWAWKKYGKK